MEEINLWRKAVDVDHLSRQSIRELKSLESFSFQQKRRFLWELISNAKDCCPTFQDKVKIFITLEDNRLLFEHDRPTFTIRELVSLIKMRSSRDFTQREGEPRRYGVGFVLTHVLNPCVRVSGILETVNGPKPFTILLNRDVKTLLDWSVNLKNNFNQLTSVCYCPSLEKSEGRARFEYHLTQSVYLIAEDAIKDLLRNIAFFLVLSPEIESITVVTQEMNKTYEIQVHNYSATLQIAIMNTQKEMMLKKGSSGAVVGVFTSMMREIFRCNDKQAKFFKKYPLIGTEAFNIPCFMYHPLLEPNSDWSGVRTFNPEPRMENKVVENNRKALIELFNLWESMITELVDACTFRNVHILAENGLPPLKDEFDSPWFKYQIQWKFREFIRTKPLIELSDGSRAKIEECVFPYFPNDPRAFYELSIPIISKIHPTRKLPTLDSIASWNQILNQEPENWPVSVTFDPEDLVSFIHGKVVHCIYIDLNKALAWLKKLFEFLVRHKPSKYLEEKAIHLNQANQLCLCKNLYIDPGISRKLKDIGQTFEDMRSVLLHKCFDAFGLVTRKYSLKVFYGKIEEYMKKHKGCGDDREKRVSIISMAFLKKEIPSEAKMNKLFRLTQQLVPTIKSCVVKEESLVGLNVKPIVHWTLSYLCRVVENSVAFFHFREKFPSSGDCYTWLNLLYEVICAFEKQTLFLEHNIIPYQDGKLRKYADDAYCEDCPEEFENHEVSFKKLYHQYIVDANGHPVDPRSFIIDNRISCPYFRKRSVTALCSTIDLIFANVDFFRYGRPICGLYNDVSILCSRDARRWNWFPNFVRNKHLISLRILTTMHLRPEEEPAPMVGQSNSIRPEPLSSHLVNNTPFFIDSNSGWSQYHGQSFNPVSGFKEWAAEYNLPKGN